MRDLVFYITDTFFMEASNLRLKQTTSSRVDEIRKRTCAYRGKLYKRTVSILTMSCVLLLCTLVGMFFSSESLSCVVVLDGCSSVLLNGSAGIYVVIGLAAFLLGAVTVILSVKLRNNHNKLSSREDKNEL